MNIKNPISKRHYTLNTAWATFIVDERIFTPELAKEWINNYYDWADPEADPQVECLQLIAVEAIKEHTNTGDFAHHVVSELEKRYDNVYTLSGKHGVELIDVMGIRFPLNDLTVTTITLDVQDMRSSEQVRQLLISTPIPD